MLHQQDRPRLELKVQRSGPPSGSSPPSLASSMMAQRKWHHTDLLGFNATSTASTPSRLGSVISCCYQSVRCFWESSKALRCKRYRYSPTPTVVMDSHIALSSSSADLPRSISKNDGGPSWHFGDKYRVYTLDQNPTKIQYIKMSPQQCYQHQLLHTEQES